MKAKNGLLAYINGDSRMQLQETIDNTNIASSKVYLACSHVIHKPQGSTVCGLINFSKFPTL